MRVAGIDPGKHACAWALAVDGLITSVYYGPPSEGLDHIVDELWCEVPCVYPHGKARPNDLIQVAIGLGRAIECFSYAKRVDVYPRQWKGTVPKDVFVDRIWGAMSDSERVVVDGLKLPKTKRHNVVDACGLVLHALGRL